MKKVLKKILFSPVGTTDPARGCFDGALVHITRHYKPDVVYIFLTKEMAEHDNKDNRYERYVKEVHPECEVKKFYSEISAAHEFDQFISIFAEKVQMIIDENGENIELLFNISSGTPAMKTALALEARWRRIKSKAIQVSSPQNKSNIDNNPEVKNFMFEDNWDVNIDNEGESENRCKEVDLLLLRKKVAQYQILTLVERYDYAAAIIVLNSMSTDLFGENLLKLLKHSESRMALKTYKAQSICNKIENIDLFPLKKNKEEEEIAEFLMLMRIKQEKNELNDFLLRISPLASKLAEFYLKENLKFSLDELIVSNNGVKNIKRENLEKYDKKNGTKLLSYLDEQYGVGFKNGFLKFEHLVKIMEYLLSCEKPNFNKPVNEINEIFELFKKMRECEEKLRNLVAHEITVVTEEKIKDKVQKNSSSILNDVERLFRKILGERAGQYIFIYKKINELIYKILN